MGGYEDLGSKSERAFTGHPDVLHFKKDDKFTVRLMDDLLAEEIWYHSCRDHMTNFVKVFCVGTRNGCPLCEVNWSEQFINAKNIDRPYPLRSEYAKAVYVYEQNAFKIVVGKVIWIEQIKPIGVRHKTLINRDLELSRMDTKQRVAYSAIPLDPTSFSKDVSGLRVPTIEDYRTYLKGNITKVEVIRVERGKGMPPEAHNEGAGSAPSSDGIHRHVEAPAPATPASAPAPATPVPAPQAQGVEPEREELKRRFSLLIQKKWIPEVLGKLQAKYLQGGKQIEQLPIADFKSFVDEYQSEAKVTL